MEQELPQIDFKHSTPIQTRFNDFDMFGHANNGAYLQYCDVAKLAYFSQFMEGPFDPAANGLVIASIKCDFISQIVPADDVEVLTAVTRIGNKSLVLDQQVVSHGRKHVHAVVSNVMVQFDVATGETTAISDEWRRKLSSFEGHDL